MCVCVCVRCMCISLNIATNLKYLIQPCMLSN